MSLLNIRKSFNSNSPKKQKGLLLGGTGTVLLFIIADILINQLVYINYLNDLVDPNKQEELVNDNRRTAIIILSTLGIIASLVLLFTSKSNNAIYLVSIINTIIILGYITSNTVPDTTDIRYGFTLVNSHISLYTNIVLGVLLLLALIGISIIPSPVLTNLFN